ncbi:hypothetical protein IFR04_016132 [Cadophora malorum]|uniref:Succinate-semialdehyde dehydrogenase, mitochondrial n=1 Tax=Cadophora malorum TaxID=108018 RepID=A0A8H7T1T8_9HELO|nr:hypothetical protein IFR04_016132 [Cadophora malorum]
MAFQSYKLLTHRQRKALLRQWTTLIRCNRDDLAAICTLELGKPITESYTTVDYGISFLDWFDGEIERLYGDTIPAAKANVRIFTTREPQGVVAAITPWNSPIAMICRKVGAAIAAGNTVVLKPAPETPMCAIAIAKLFERVKGFPPGSLNIVIGDAKASAEMGDELCHNRLVRHLSFTGSTGVGKFLNSECGKSLKRTSMELGGNAPFIVFEDANIEKAVDGLIASKFRSSGQTCVCANRAFVHRSIINEFARVLKTRTNALFNYGSVWDPAVNFGPLYCAKGVEKVVRHLDDAVSKGAKVVEGGFVNKDLGPNFYVPTILIGAKLPETLLSSTEEAFGPIIHLNPFDTDEEVIELANTEESGLASYFYTESISRLWKVSEALSTGMVGVRVGLVSACEQPFGGIKESGLGREGGRFGVEDYTNIKSITVGL